MKIRTIATTVALVAAGAGLGIASQQFATAELSSGDRPVLVSITPCRLADSRDSNNVGPLLGKLGAGEVQTYDVGDPSTECAGEIPSDAVAISTNVTALGATTLTYLTIWPNGSPQPLASSLNPAPGEPPTPNAVVTSISSSGEFDVYNHEGETHVLIDVNGYYVHHTHDDLYGTGGDEPETVSVGAAAFDAWESQFGWQKSVEVGTGSGGAWITSNPHAGVVPELVAPVQLPDGATITGVTAYFEDTSAIASLDLQLRCERHAGGVIKVFGGSTTADPTAGEVALSVSAPTATTVDNSTCSYFVAAASGSWGSETSALKVRGFVVETS